ncbi:MULTISPECIES: helix-turn-helix domain-containing protein [unclassified Microcoleus]|uniref:helix-turn-helix transcriptional regulator n=1 Tax=unclassified Microcoleus TaxID=2642155 RepID=UPI0025EA1B8B|nr:MULTISPECIES: helix-turn-helix domain-containing protein [unclassified Microcoleus]TAE14682.1 MAG: helix-turn-helix domain-containing protein [Oscillatoriales cyanobacterium]
MEAEDRETITLKNLRESANLTQPELSRRMGVGIRIIGDWERGEAIPRFDRVIALARELGVPLKTLARCMGLDVAKIPDDLQALSVLHLSTEVKKPESLKQASCIREENSQEKEKSPLRLLREQAGLTRPQVKQHIGVSERMQADWESGKSMPTVENVAALANLYQVSLKTMFELLGLDVTKIPDDLSSRSRGRSDK